MYTEKELVSFGNYLLGKEREALIKSGDAEILYEERAGCVSDADLRNWQEKEAREFRKVYPDLDAE